MWLNRNSDEIAKSRVLHFAAEESLQSLLRETVKAYTTADFKSGYDLQLNMEHIDLPQDSFDCVICNHVLEHVDDREATKEIRRILAEKGFLIASVPIIEGWEKTYENPAVVSETERTLHFGQYDHVRFYGRDFRDRVCEAGFVLEEEFTAGGEDSVKYGLIRGEKIFIFRKK
jgi:SAM-dependent methyltransferase